MKWKYKIILPVIILISGFIAMQSLLAMRTAPPKRSSTPRPKSVESVVARLEPLSTFVSGLGRVVSSQPVSLYSEVSGILEKGQIEFQPARNFKQGDLMLKIDDRPVKLDINSAKSRLLNALAAVLPEIKVGFPQEYDQWQEYFDNLGFEGELEPLPHTENKKIKLYLSRYNVYQLYFDVRDLEIQLSKHYFYAPFNGTIESAALRVGSTARVGTYLGNIVSLEDLELEVPLSLSDIGWIDRNKNIVLSSMDSQAQWTGRISRIGNIIDNETQTVPVFVSLDEMNSRPVLNGLYMEAEIPGRIIENAIRLPRKAIYNNKSVYLVDNGKLKNQPVEIAKFETESVLISKGINNGDTIVVEPLQGITSNMLAVARLTETSQPEAQ